MWRIEDFNIWTSEPVLRKKIDKIMGIRMTKDANVNKIERKVCKMGNYGSLPKVQINICCAQVYVEQNY